jgi:hypothetical protein
MYFKKHQERRARRLQTQRNDKEMEMSVTQIASIHAVYVLKYCSVPHKKRHVLHVNTFLKIKKNG